MDAGPHLPATGAQASAHGKGAVGVTDQAPGVHAPVLTYGEGGEAGGAVVHGGPPPQGASAAHQLQVVGHVRGRSDDAYLPVSRVQATRVAGVMAAGRGRRPAPGASRPNNANVAGDGAIGIGQGHGVGAEAGVAEGAGSHPQGRGAVGGAPDVYGRGRQRGIVVEGVGSRSGPRQPARRHRAPRRRIRSRRRSRPRRFQRPATVVSTRK